MSAASIEFRYRNVRHGWCDVTFASGDQSVLVGPSHLTDALKQLLVAVRDMLSHGRALCLWENEPERIELVFTNRSGVLHLRVRMVEEEPIPETPFEPGVLYAPPAPPAYDPADHDGEVLFDAEGDALAFAGRVVAEADALLAELGPQGYEKAWRRPFPVEALRELRLVIETRR